ANSGVSMQAGASVRVDWDLALGRGAEILGWYSPSQADVVTDQTLDTNAFELTLGGRIAGAGRVVKRGSGTLVLVPEVVNSSLGGILVQEGTLRVSTDRSLGVLATDRLRLCENSPYDGPPCTALPAMTAPLELDGGTLQAAATFRIDRDVVIGSR